MNNKRYTALAAAMLLTTGVLQAATWTNSISGDWDTATNWETGVVPDGVDVFFTNATQDITVTLNTDHTATRLAFSSASYATVLEGTGKLTVIGKNSSDITFSGYPGTPTFDIKTDLVISNTVELVNKYSDCRKLSCNIHFLPNSGLENANGGIPVTLAGRLSGAPRFGAYGYWVLTGTSTLTNAIYCGYAVLEVATGANLSMNVPGVGTAVTIDRTGYLYLQTGGTVDLADDTLQLGSNNNVTGRVTGGTLTAGAVLVHANGGWFMVKGGVVRLATGIVDISNRMANFEFTGGTLASTSDSFQLRNLRGGGAAAPDFLPVVQDATNGPSLLDLSNYNAWFNKTAYRAEVSAGSDTATVRVGKTLTLSALDLNGNPNLLTIATGARLELLDGATITGGGGVVVTNTGVLALGTNGTASAAVSNLTLQAGAVLEWDMMDAATYDRLAVTNVNLTADGTITIKIQGLAGHAAVTAGQTFTLVSGTVQNFAAERFTVVDSAVLWKSGWEVRQQDGGLQLRALPPRGTVICCQ